MGNGFSELTRTRGDITTEELLKIKEARIKELEDQLETPQVIFLKERLEFLTKCLRIRDCAPSWAYSNKCQCCKNKQLIDNGFSEGE